MLLEIDIDHDDPGYVEARGGFALLSYLRSGAERSAHRREAIDRALTLFEQAERDGKPDPEVGGLGLLVLQRALLAAEDLGALVHGLLGPDPWLRLRNARIREIDEAYGRALRDFDDALVKVFVLASEQQIDEGAATVDQRVALKELRVREARRWHRMLERVAGFWFGNRNAAKATMHGYPVVAGAHLHGPPPAGVLAAGVPPLAYRFAMAITSTVKEAPPPMGQVMLDAAGDPIAHKEVRSDRTLIRLDAGQARDFARSGRLAANLADELCEMQVRTVMSRHGVSVPLRGIERLDERGRRALADLAP